MIIYPHHKYGIIIRSKSTEMKIYLFYEKPLQELYKKENHMTDLNLRGTEVTLSRLSKNCHLSFGLMQRIHHSGY